MQTNSGPVNDNNQSQTSRGLPNQATSSNNNNNKWVVNLSKTLLTPTQYSVLGKGPKVKDNLTKEERKALTELKRDPDRMVLTVDNRIALVVLHKEEYDQKADNLLDQPNYRSIYRDPTKNQGQANSNT